MGFFTYEMSQNLAIGCYEAEQRLGKLYDSPPWQTKTIQYQRHLTGRLKWPEGLWKFCSSSQPHQRGRALALCRLNRAWLGMSKFEYLSKKQGHFKLTMLCLFIYLWIYYV